MLKTAMKKLWTLSVFDRAIFKICLIALSLMLATLIPALVQVKRRVYAIIGFVTYMYVLWRLFIKK